MNGEKVNSYSLLIDLNNVDPEKYEGWDGELPCCEDDVNSIAEISKKEKFETIVKLFTKKATRGNVAEELKKAAEMVEEGGTFLLYYSGHGNFIDDIPDLNDIKDEKDKKDETWCLYDGEMVDDEIFTFWLRFKPDVKILMISDSCHSGSVFKAALPSDPVIRELRKNYSKPKIMPAKIRRKMVENKIDVYKSLLSQKQITKGKKEKVKATVLLLSACRDNQQAMAGDINSLFTSKILDLYNSGESKNYKDLLISIEEEIGSIQSPKYSKLGAKNQDFEMEKPFKIK